ncbi:hypothetical protein [Streptomyces spiralis]|uniref:hypothetical protein n=1 Tax=Streptomyces spiralis TaxID=66376 RepID=UPI0016749A9E|nr:hypothetical protein [Streptomyces spiralis]
MVDPISTAASAAAKTATSALTKRLQSKAGIRLGSREERRQVYARFQTAATASAQAFAAVHLEYQLYSISLGRKRRVVIAPARAHRLAVHLLREQRADHSELVDAYLDLRLAANPAPLEAANEVLNAHSRVLNVGLEAPSEDVSAAVNALVVAQREFADVCRDDLWYLPTWWQAYRPAWWSARRWRRRRSA